MNFSVLMSLYIKEKPEYARECFESLLNQTVKAKEWVIVEDGPLTDEMYSLLAEYEEENPGLIKRVPLKKNVGLGLALREGVVNCSYDIIARMDTDDIAVRDRFEKQLSMFKADSKLDICGSHIKEFIGDIKNIQSERNVPLTQKEIYKYQKKRSAFNHMTVMYKKKAVLDAGNYVHAPLMEDDMLWVYMMKNHCRCMNLDEYLVYARVGKDMYARRGGFSYFKKYKAARKKIYETGYISYWDYISTVLIQFVVALIPVKVRKFIFTKLLRK